VKILAIQGAKKTLFERAIPKHRVKQPLPIDNGQELGLLGNFSILKHLFRGTSNSGDKEDV